MTTLRLDYVSPLPPVRSGIADYSVDLIPELAERCDLRLGILPALPIAESVLARWPWTQVSEVGEGGRLPLYQMGNNHYHQGVWDLAMTRPGVLTLHDLVLHHFLLDRSFHRSDGVATYRAALGADHGWIGDVVATIGRWGVLNDATQFSLPARRTLLRRQRGVLVHSTWAAEHLREEDPDLRVAAVPMGVPLPPLADPEGGRTLRDRYGIPPEAPLLGSLGFQTPIKRTSKAIQALARPELADAHLLVAGEASSILDLEGDASEAGVAERVHVTGFMGFDEYQDAIAACDLCLNLRYPTAGETSAALLRTLAVGRPAIVSEFAQFADLPDAVAVKVPVGEGEVEALALRVGELLADRERLAAMSEAAREHVRLQHDPGATAERVVELCSEWRDAPPPGDAPVEVEPPTSLVWSRLPGDLEVRGAEPSWRVGQARTLTIRLANRGFARWLSTERGAGGVVVKIEFRGPDDGAVGEGSWAPLLPDLDPGQSEELRAVVRRPVGAARIIVEPHVIGRSGLGALGGPVWTAHL